MSKDAQGANSEAPEVTENTENGTTEGTEDALLKLSKEELAEEIRKTRREAAAKRVANKEKDAELEEFRKWKESQMTELEKVQARVSELNETLSSKEIDFALELAQVKYGLTEEDLEFVTGTSRDEILAKAEKYAARLGKGKPEDQPSGKNTPNLFAGAARRGAPVGAGAKNDPNEMLRAQLRAL